VTTEPVGFALFAPKWGPPDPADGTTYSEYAISELQDAVDRLELRIARLERAWPPGRPLTLDELQAKGIVQRVVSEEKFAAEKSQAHKQQDSGE
jgi:hypothetical protein